MVSDTSKWRLAEKRLYKEEELCETLLGVLSRRRKKMYDKKKKVYEGGKYENKCQNNSMS